MEVKDSLPDEHLQDNTQSEKIVIKRKRNIAIFIVVSLLNVGLLALLWTQLLTPAQNQGSTSSDGPNVANPLKGRPAPGFRLAALGTGQGSTLDMASLKGKAVVLNFWSSSCVPCQDEAHLLQSTWQHMQSKGVVFVGVDFEADSLVAFRHREADNHTNRRWQARVFQEMRCAKRILPGLHADGLANVTVALTAECDVKAIERK